MANHSTTIRTPRAKSKTEMARRIFSQMSGFARPFVLKRMEEELNMTPQGAATYYQNCRKAAGLTKSRTAG